jgi:hypothetical protein
MILDWEVVQTLESGWGFASTSIRVLMSLDATFNIEIEQMDVKTTFLHGDLEEEIYMKQPAGFVLKGK